jgi:hypothetical protein
LPILAYQCRLHRHRHRSDYDVRHNLHMYRHFSLLQTSHSQLRKSQR